MDRLTFAVLSDTLAEIRRVTARCGKDKYPTIDLLQRHFTIWERGILLNAACFLLDFPEVPVEIPSGAFVIARGVVAEEFTHGFHEELLAVSMGGAPWRSHLSPDCLQCGTSATWRQVMYPPEGLPPELCWRYDRPENHVPMCRRCITRLAYRKTQSRIELVHALWGARFEAFQRWHHAFVCGALPDDWDSSLNPLWPAEFGGQTWAAGCGALECADPRMYFGVVRSADQKARLNAFLGPDRMKEIFRPGCEFGFDQLLQPLDIGAGQVLGALS